MKSLDQQFIETNDSMYEENEDSITDKLNDVRVTKKSLVRNSLDELPGKLKSPFAVDSAIVSTRMKDSKRAFNATMDVGFGMKGDHRRSTDLPSVSVLGGSGAASIRGS